MKKLALIFVLAAVVVAFAACNKDDSPADTTIAAGTTTVAVGTTAEPTESTTEPTESTTELTESTTEPTEPAVNTTAEPPVDTTTAFNGIETDEDGNRWTPQY